MKRISDSSDLMKQFISHHKIELSIDENEAEHNGGVISENANQMSEERVVECGDSTKSSIKDAVEETTPKTKKIVGKRVTDSVGSATKDVEDVGEKSITKPTKLKCVKQEKGGA